MWADICLAFRQLFQSPEQRAADDRQHGRKFARQQLASGVTYDDLLAEYENSVAFDQGSTFDKGVYDVLLEVVEQRNAPRRGLRLVRSSDKEN